MRPNSRPSTKSSEAAAAPPGRPGTVGDACHTRAIVNLTQGLFDPPILATGAALVEDLDGLWPEERALIDRAGRKRQREFASGRRCAHALLDRLGMDAGPLLRSASGAPVWPEAVTGSISHTDDACVAAVAPSSCVAGVGIDVERDAPLAEPLWRRITTAREAAWLEAREPGDRGVDAKRLFSAKEAAGKAFAARLDRCPALSRIEIAFTGTNDFEARLEDGSVGELHGRIRHTGHWVVTSAVLARSSQTDGRLP